MVALLIRLSALSALAVLASQAASAEISDRHELAIEFEWNLTDTQSSLGAWPEGGFGKLRQDSRGSDYGSTRLAIEYQGQIKPTLFVRAVGDAVDDGTTTAGLTEAYLEWRPLPNSLNRNRLRIGAFYPAFSMENSGLAWTSPYSRSFSSVNSWLGEEIRPVGIDWRLSRPVGAQGSPGEISTFAGAFYGNDPAGTLLFWRGWAVHDRQTRLNERLQLPPLVFPGQAGNPDTVIQRQLDPIAEIDDRPGFYAGSEWRYARRARVSLSFYDNRGDPYAFRDGQWAWGTRFWHLATQVSLPGDVGLIAQRMRGDTDWLVSPSNDGTLTPFTRYVTDEFDAAFILLSKMLDRRHRISFRLDRFEMWRPGELEIDQGRALTAAYSFAVNRRLDMQLEWMEIESSRDLWPLLYGQQASDYTERVVQLGFRIALFNSAN